MATIEKTGTTGTTQEAGARANTQTSAAERPRARRAEGFAALSLVLGLGLGASAPAVAWAEKPQTLTLAAPEPDQASAQKPRIEVVFVLDTTGSMSGLIEGAKQKIWSIADELASAKPTPDLRVGLIAYRDRGDAYVTRRFALTDDLDTIYEHLRGLSAEGGGDEPESVNQALYEAVVKTPWTQGPSVYRTVFLVGDAPPHMDYRNDVPYTRTATLANKAGVVINTVQCGRLAGTEAVWTALAKRTQGAYGAIGQSAGMVAVAAPMDAEIEKLNAELADTVLAYGDSEQKAIVEKKARIAKQASAEAGAARRAYLGKKGGGGVTGSGDLVDDVREGRVSLGTLSASQAPAALAGRSKEEQAAELTRRAHARSEIKAKLDKLVSERDAYVKSEEEKLRASGKKDGFDAEVKRAVKAQAAAAGLSYSE